MKEATRKLWVFAIVLMVAGLASLAYASRLLPAAATQFSGESAFDHVEAQVGFGPRVIGSEAHRLTAEYIATTLAEYGWEVEVQELTRDGLPIRNVIARAGAGPAILVGAHYDSRSRADKDPVSPDLPVPGANDGASGAAVLLELARSLDESQLTSEVWLVFFDAEDDGGIDGKDWILGSRAFAEAMVAPPSAVVIVDMIGDRDQQIYFDANSDPDLSARLWALAAELGYGRWFIPVEKYAILDDHTPFAERGIPAVDIIDFDYPHWHTTQDTLDKVSPESLERVGRLLEYWLENSPRTQ